MNLRRAKDAAKGLLQSSELGRFAYSRAQELWFDSTYRARVRHYTEATAGDSDAYRQEAHLQRCRRKIAERGYRSPLRAAGEAHCFAFLPSHWSHQNQIATALALTGPCTRFDYASNGISLKELRTAAPGHIEKRRAVMEGLLAAIRAAHRQRPIDWFFSYAIGYDILPEALTRIRDELGIPTVNVSFDDKNWWNEIERGDSSTGMKQLAPHFDLSWTSARNVLPWYWAEGGQAIFLPEGVNVDWFKPLDIEQDIDVGFVGNNFGYRPELLGALRHAGVKVAHHGTGWPDSSELNDEQMRIFFNRCLINLGHGDMHYSRWLTNLKGRDFEIPAVGRGLYLTSYSSDLASCFDIAREIQCYRGIDELVDLVRRYLRNRDEIAEMARRARDRCIREHQWSHRFQALLRALGILETARQPRTNSPST